MNIQTINQISNDNSAITVERGGLFGDGFFTTGLIDSGKLRHQEEHFKRLKNTANKLKFNHFDINEIEKSLYKVTKNLKRAVIRISVERTQASRGYAIAAEHEAKVTILVSPWMDKPSLFCELIISEIPISKNSYLAGLKHLNRLDNVLAASECIKSDQEALLCDGEQVICGSRTNLFIFHDDVWKTPELKQAGIEGITKKRLLALMKDREITCLQTSISKNDLLNCQSAFITNSLVGIWPVSKINDKTLATKLSCALQSELNFTR
ncbi:aminodeoxychorismate lyase [Aliikangiella sp. IMCC44359]|uniref:aminodeoxychorismate lyase n=1 Tax=Aliikangiella sp. IMCC44359 TaxID=3459125 RepID=UPI00403AA168